MGFWELAGPKPWKALSCSLLTLSTILLSEWKVLQPCEGSQSHLNSLTQECMYIKSNIWFPPHPWTTPGGSEEAENSSKLMCLVNHYCGEQGFSEPFQWVAGKESSLCKIVPRFLTELNPAWLIFVGFPVCISMCLPSIPLFGRTIPNGKKKNPASCCNSCSFCWCRVLCSSPLPSS